MLRDPALGVRVSCRSFFFFFNDTATTEIYTLSLHDALPICWQPALHWKPRLCSGETPSCSDRKSTRLNSSHGYISYAVFCLKKKKKDNRLSPTDSRVEHSIRFVHHHCDVTRGSTDPPAYANP